MMTSTSELKQKALKVIWSCQTMAHAKTAMRYLDLLARQHQEVPVMMLKQELVTLFDLGERQW